LGSILDFAFFPSTYGFWHNIWKAFPRIGNSLQPFMYFLNYDSLKKEVKMTAIKRMMVLFVALAMVMAFCGSIQAENTGKINLNKATVEEISQLKGIGMKYAERIVQYRDKNGPFKNIEDLLNVQGIGPKTLEKNKDRIIIK
jgi:competence protein ComEA